MPSTLSVVRGLNGASGSRVGICARLLFQHAAVAMHTKDQLRCARWLRKSVMTKGIVLFLSLVSTLKVRSAFRVEERCEKHCREFRNERQLVRALSTTTGDFSELSSVGYPPGAHTGGIEHLVCPSNFRDMAQIVYEWPWGHFLKDTTSFWDPKLAAKCARGVLTVYSKTDKHVHTSLLKFLSRLDEKFIIITGQGGSPATRELYIKLSKIPNFVHWFGQNGEFEDRAFSPIPVGINCFEHGDVIVKTLANAHAQSATGRKLLLVAFSTHTHPSRRDVYDYFCTQNHFSWVTCLHKQKGPVINSTKLEQFYDVLRQHKYIISPRGAGHDAHRQYEAMYLGVIPVVVAGVLSSLQSEFPILTVNNWYEVSEEFLEARWHEFSRRLDKPIMALRREYWLAKIERVRQSAMQQYHVTTRGRQC